MPAPEPGSSGAKQPGRPRLPGLRPFNPSPVEGRDLDPAPGGGTTPGIGSGGYDRDIVPGDVRIPGDEHEPSQLRLRHQQAVEGVTVVHG